MPYKSLITIPMQSLSQKLCLKLPFSSLTLTLGHLNRMHTRVLQQYRQEQGINIASQICQQILGQ